MRPSPGLGLNARPGGSGLFWELTLREASARQDHVEHL